MSSLHFLKPTWRTGEINHQANAQYNRFQVEQEGHTKKHNEWGENGILVQNQFLARSRDDLNCQLIANLKHHRSGSVAGI
jgi:hypothetical protein